MRSAPNGLRAVSVVVLSASTLALAACQGKDTAASPPPSGASGAPASAAAPDPAAAPAAARIGAPGSACELPVTLAVAESWKPKAVTIDPNHELAGLARMGPLTMACEIDAKPAGAIGYLRVWTGPKTELRASLTALIGKNAEKPAFTELQLAGSRALEVTYQEKSPLDGTTSPERAFAVQTASGVVAVNLDSFDDQEFTAMLPAYELAKSSLTVAD